MKLPIAKFRVVLVALLFSSFAFAAANLTGTVKNSTTGKPSPGDDVVLLKLGQGMEEAGRTKSDAKGNFTFSVEDAQAPHLVRVIHQEVTYHRMAPPGSTSVEVEVFDVANKVDNIAVVADIMRVQVEQGQMEVMRAFAVKNTSQPPRTQMNDRNIEFYVPAGAQILEGLATTQGGNTLKLNPVQERDKTRYSFIFPLRPGVTQFQVAYQLPYTGSANLDPRPLYPLQHFVAILPKTIQFEAAPGTNYQPMNDPAQPDANVQVASGTTVGQSLAFKISGEGTLQARSEGGDSGQGEQASSAPENRPGGGLGPPIDAPDPLQKYRWWILGGFAVILVGGGIAIASRQQAAARAARVGPLTVQMHDVDYDPDTLGGSALTSRAVTSQRSSSMLLEGLKEELFQLEVEHKQGHISQQEYEQTKAALDQTLQRALKREAAKQA